MSVDAWWQISGAVVGSLVGGFSGFLANSISHRSQARSNRRSVASALVGEIEALCEQVELHYLARLRGDAESEGNGSGGRYAHHFFRGQRDYMPIFRSLGGSIGCLPSPLPRDLAFWYTGFSTCLERAHELHDLALRSDCQWLESAKSLTGEQREAIAQLLKEAPSLLDRLSKLR